MTRKSTIAEQRKIAETVIAHEAMLRPSDWANGAAVNPILERLMPLLTPLLGKVGYCSLVARALILAQREAEPLRGLKMKPDCTLEGYTSQAAQANPILISYIIELLTTFIGRTLTMRLLQNAWPELPALRRAPGESTNDE